MSKVFRPWKTDEVWLLPPSVADFVPAGHPAHLIRDLVSEELDLSAIIGAYTEVKGYPPYHPAMMVALLLYAYRSGIYSSRRIARGCEERLDFQAVTALNQPDFRTISEFRRRPSRPWRASSCRCWRFAARLAWPGSIMSLWTARRSKPTRRSTRR
jgi:transposase